MDQNIQENFNGHNYEEVLCNLHDFIEMDRSYFKHVRDISGQGSFWEFLRDYSFSFYRSVKLHISLYISRSTSFQTLNTTLSIAPS